ncbi:MAG: hypothetical protein PHQ47_02650 [Candidatus Portnoybacteria bacterium]|nr:hypothetical protein [Candidatus Portnoybacteria bacterium]
MPGQIMFAEPKRNWWQNLILPCYSQFVFISGILTLAFLDVYSRRETVGPKRWKDLDLLSRREKKIGLNQWRDLLIPLWLTSVIFNKIFILLLLLISKKQAQPIKWKKLLLPATLLIQLFSTIIWLIAFGLPDEK